MSKKQEEWLVQWSNGGNGKNKRGKQGKQIVYSQGEAISLAQEKTSNGSKMVKFKRML